MGSRIGNLKNKTSIERSLMAQGTLINNSVAQKVQDQFYNNSFNRVGKQQQESQSSGGFKGANDSTSK